jgi:DNA-binding NarL/FixJ family response regulator
MTKPRVLLADDHTLLLEAFKRLLEPEFEVVGAAVDGRALLAQAEALRPDVIVSDISMPGMNGLEACARIKALRPGTAIVYLTVNADPHVAAEAFRAGASGYLLKSTTGSELAAAIRASLRGEQFLSVVIAGGDPAALPTRPADSVWSTLSPREREVVQLIAEGHGMKQVAAALGISARTVEFHKYRAMQSLGVTSNAELVRVALAQKLS